MNVIRKIALLLETLIGFGFIVYIWFLGLIMSPVFVLRLVMGEVEMVPLILTVILGAVGLWGMAQLTVKVVQPGARVTAPRLLLGFVVCGLTAVCIAAALFGLEPGWWGLIFLLPVLVTLHFLYMARAYFGLSRE